MPWFFSYSLNLWTGMMMPVDVCQNTSQDERTAGIIGFPYMKMEARSMRRSLTARLRESAVGWAERWRRNPSVWNTPNMIRWMFIASREYSTQAHGNSRGVDVVLLARSCHAGCEKVSDMSDRLLTPNDRRQCRLEGLTMLCIRRRCLPSIHVRLSGSDT